MKDLELDFLGEEMVYALQYKLNEMGNGNSSLSKSIGYSISNNVVVITMNDYGFYLDSGTKPHMPPVDSLNEWANSKGLNAWAVAMNIKKYGTKAQPFIHVVDGIQDRLFEEFNDKLFPQLIVETEEILLKYFKKIQ